MSVVNQIEFNIDMVPNGGRPVVHVSEGDVGRTYKANLFYNGVSFTPTDVSEVELTGLYQNDFAPAPATGSWSSGNSYVTFTLPADFCKISGQLLCEIRLKDTSDNDIGSGNFVLMVERGYSENAAIVDYPTVSETINEAVSTATAAATSASASATAAAGSATSAQEAADNAQAAADYVDDVWTTFDGTVEDYEFKRNMWFRVHDAAGMAPDELTTLCETWYEKTRLSWTGGVEFLQPDVNTGSTGQRVGDNAGMTCEPSTDTVAGQDDYAGHPLFAVTTVNWTLDDNGEVLITAIKGVSGDFEQNNPEKFVGVMQMSASAWQTENGASYTVWYSSNIANGKALPEAIKLDGTVRQFVCHSKYMAGTVNGKLTCCSGVIPTDKMSHNAGITAARTVGANYSAGTVVDWSFIYLMTLIKYASMTLDGIINGCFIYNFQYPAQVAETRVQRVLVSASYKDGILVGSSVLVGNYAGNKDRGQDAMRSIAIATVAAVETVTVDGTQYAAVYLNCPSFDTAANGADTDGTTYISSWHWASGTNDDVLGNDGCHGSLTDAKHPAMIQGIEFAVGAYEVFTDVILNIADGVYTPYIARQAIYQATSVTDNMVASELTSAQPDENGWDFIRKMSYDGELFFGTDTDGGSSGTYTRDGFYKNGTATTTGTREWLAFGLLYDGVGYCGPACLCGCYSPGTAYWYCALRLSCNGNRGELAS